LPVEEPKKKKGKKAVGRVNEDDELKRALAASMQTFNEEKKDTF
jgi:UDP:flavonoid glycosyltransferase YjiC (YdhE family)